MPDTTRPEIVIVLSARCVYGEFFHDSAINHLASSLALAERIERALAPQYVATLVVVHGDEYSAKVVGEVSLGEMTTILSRAYTCWQADGWTVFH